MSIATYDDLLDTISRYLARSDIAVDDFVSLAESRIYYGSDDQTYPSPPLRIRAMEKSVDCKQFHTRVAVSEIPLPTGFLAVRSLGLDVTPFAKLELVSPEQLNSHRGKSGRPRYGCIFGNSLRLAPVPDGEYGVVMDYYSTLGAVSLGEPNWLLENAPGIYLYASLLEAEPFLMHDERLPIWAAMFSSLTRSMMESEQSTRFGTGEITSRVNGETP